MASVEAIPKSGFLRCLKFVIYGAVVARITLYIIKKYRESLEGPKSVDKWSLAEVAKHIEEAKEAAKKAKEDVKEIVSEVSEEITEEVVETIGEITDDIKNKLLTPELQEAIDTIQYLVENVEQYALGSSSLQHSTLLLLALLSRVQQEQELPKWKHQLPASILMDSQEVNKIQRLGSMALNTYTASWSQGCEGVAGAMGVTKDDILFIWNKDDPSAGLCPKFVVLVDHELSSVVIAIRGTFCLKDVILDMVCSDCPFLSGFAHRGILEGAQAVWAECCPAVISALTLYPGYKVSVTGHSLGAGTAVLLAMELTMGESATSLPRDCDVECVALAPPPVYREAPSLLGPSSLAPEMTSRVTVLVLGSDVVPRVSLGTLAWLLLALRALDTLGLTLTQVGQGLGWGDQVEGASIRAKVGEVIRGVTQGEFPYLQHPGKILYLESLEDDGSTGEGDHGVKVAPLNSQQLSEHILLLPGMLKDHRKVSYQAALDLLSNT